MQPEHATTQTQTKATLVAGLAVENMRLRQDVERLLAANAVLVRAVSAANDVQRAAFDGWATAWQENRRLIDENTQLRRDLAAERILKTACQCSDTEHLNRIQ